MNDIQHFAKLIKDIKFAMLTTIDQSDDTLHSRPMTLQQLEFDGDLWFFASQSSTLVNQIMLSPKVNLAFANSKDSSYLSASGEAEVIIDLQKTKELWSPFFKAWFSLGPDDPDLCLIKVRVEKADYWESPSSKLITLIGFAKAILKGKKVVPEVLAGEHGHLDLGH